MKRKIIMCSLLSLVGLSLTATDAFAFWWRLHNKYQSIVVCRPYNAFTPVCYGNIVCDGCCPSNPCHAASCMPNMFPPSYCGMPMPSYGGCCDPCGPGYPVTSMAAPVHMAPPMHMQMPAGPMQTQPPPMAPQPGFTPPLPNMQQTYYQGTNIPYSYPPYYGYNYMPWNSNVYPVSYQQGWPTGYSPNYWYGGYGR